MKWCHHCGDSFASDAEHLKAVGKKRLETPAAKRHLEALLRKYQPRGER